MIHTAAQQVVYRVTEAEPVETGVGCAKGFLIALPIGLLMWAPVVWLVLRWLGVL